MVLREKLALSQGEFAWIIQVSPAPCKIGSRGIVAPLAGPWLS